MNDIHYNLISMAYAVVFAGLSVMFVSSDFVSKRHWSYLLLAVISYALMTFGNVVYALGARHQYISFLWRIVAPYFVFYFIFSGVEDRKHPPKSPSLAVSICSWVLGLAIFAPTFHANLKLANLWPIF